MHLFLAEGAVKISEQNLDSNEHLFVIKISLKEAVDVVMDGRINASSTAHLIRKAA